MNAVEHEPHEQTGASGKTSKGEIGCMVFVAALVCTSVVLVMRMFVADVGLWKGLLYTLGFFGAAGVYATFRMAIRGH